MLLVNRNCGYHSVFWCKMLPRRPIFNIRDIKIREKYLSTRNIFLVLNTTRNFYVKLSHQAWHLRRKVYTVKLRIWKSELRLLSRDREIKSLKFEIWPLVNTRFNSQQKINHSVSRFAMKRLKIGKWLEFQDKNILHSGHSVNVSFLVVRCW